MQRIIEKFERDYYLVQWTKAIKVRERQLKRVAGFKNSKFRIYSPLKDVRTGIK